MLLLETIRRWARTGTQREHTLLAIRTNQQYEELVRQIEAEPVNDTSLLEARRTFEVKMGCKHDGPLEGQQGAYSFIKQQTEREKRRGSRFDAHTFDHPVG